jgi:hypothetical protein
VQKKDTTPTPSMKQADAIRRQKITGHCNVTYISMILEAAAEIGMPGMTGRSEKRWSGGANRAGVGGLVGYTGGAASDELLVGYRCGSPGGAGCPPPGGARRAFLTRKQKPGQFRLAFAFGVFASCTTRRYDDHSTRANPRA